MPRTGKSVVWKIKTTCTVLLGIAVQRDTSRTRRTHVICTCWCEKGNNGYENKTPEETLGIKGVVFTYQLMVYADMLLYWAQKNDIRNNIEDMLINSKETGLELSRINLCICSRFVNKMLENITNQR